MSVLYILKMNCREATYLHQKHSEHKLSTTEKIALKLHLLICRACRLFYKQLNGIEKCIHLAHTHDKLPGGMPEQTKLKIQRALDSEMH